METMRYNKNKIVKMELDMHDVLSKKGRWDRVFNLLMHYKNFDEWDDKNIAACFLSQIKGITRKPTNEFFSSTGKI